MSKFKLVCIGFWSDGEIAPGVEVFDANFAIVNVDTEEVVGETGRCGWDEDNLRLLHNAPCDEKGNVIFD